MPRSLGAMPRLALLASLTLAAVGPAHAAAPSAPASARGVAYVSHQDAGIAVIDLDTFQLRAELAVEGQGARGIGLTQDGQKLVVAVRESGDVQIIDIASKMVVQRIHVGKNPEFVRVRGDLAFVSYEPSSTGKPPKPGAHDARKADDDGDEEPARVAVIDLKQRKVLRHIVCGAETEGIEITPDGQRIVVTNEADHTLTLHDVRTGKRLKTVDTKRYGVRPRGIKLSPDGQTFVATLEFANKLLVLDRDLKPLRTVDTGASPYGVAFDSTGKHVLVAAARDQKLQVFDARSFDKVAEVPVGERCWHFSFTPDERQVLVTCGRSKETLVVDTASWQVTQKLPTQGLSWGVLTWPRAMGSLDQR